MQFTHKLCCFLSKECDFTWKPLTCVAKQYLHGLYYGPTQCFFVLNVFIFVFQELGFSCRNDLGENISVLAYSCSALLHLEIEKSAAATAVIQQKWRAIFTTSATVYSVLHHMMKAAQQCCAAQQLTSCEVVCLCYMSHLMHSCRVMEKHKHTLIR